MKLQPIFAYKNGFLRLCDKDLFSAYKKQGYFHLSVIQYEEKATALYVGKEKSD